MRRKESFDYSDDDREKCYECNRYLDSYGQCRFCSDFKPDNDYDDKLDGLKE